MYIQGPLTEGKTKTNVKQPTRCSRPIGPPPCVGARKSVLTREEKNMIVTGLQMRRNYIETGDVNLSALQASRLGKGNINALSSDQMRLLVKTEELITKVLSS